MKHLPFYHSPDGTSLRSDYFEAVARLTVPVRRSHAADEKQFVAAHTFLLRVEQFLAQVNPLHQTNHHPVVANVQRAPFLALQARRCFSDSRRLHNRGLERMQSRLLQFVYAVW